MTLNTRTVHHPVEDIEHTRHALLKVAGQLSQHIILRCEGGETNI
ncbi:hypothetical protein ABC733_12960 [Mangrovibacter sp. SLW1]